ncbi:FAD-dependent oxidoreductase [Dactylosporangium darangshiense]|uniref:FAD-dependent oxidoreductase n=1 Tax=Dactylosporangium darangshiense TaxID=579108 RepID=UPI0031EE7B60
MVDVVVAGAGPVGLMLACELALGGVQVVVLERREDIDQTIKAGSLNAPTIEALERRGLTPALREAAETTMAAFAAFQKTQPPFQQTQPQSGAPKQRKFAGHFGGIMLDAADLDPADERLAAAGRLGAMAIVSQQQLEAILQERALELGVDLRRGVAITGFAEEADAVVVHTSGGTLRAGWLAGCDGGRSLVRKLAGFEFPGTEPEITAYQALADLEGTSGLRPGWHATDAGVYSFGPVPGRVLVAEFGGGPADRDAPVTEAELQGAIRRVTGVDVEVTGIRTVTRFTDNARQATTYRKGRVLLAGDAAHVHSPFGGQGLNLGIGDAMNLGWKLAATVRGWAPAGLLDTYTAERHPIGAWVLDWTRAQIAIMRPDRHARALRRVLADLAGTTDGATYLATRISGVWQGYDLPGDHPLTGRTAPDLELSDGTRLADRLHGGKALLLNAKADGYEDRLTHATAEGAPRMLVRPDGYVAWASDTEDADLAPWLGGPTCSR